MTSTTKKMQCPKCHEALEKVAMGAGVVDRCTSCKGIWFEMLEHEDLKNYAKAVDIGDPAIGRQYNTMTHVNCPSCQESPMIRMVDPGQPHIWFESCPRCYGLFFDAGEFLDLSTETLGDVVRRILARERP